MSVNVSELDKDIMVAGESIRVRILKDAQRRTHNHPVVVAGESIRVRILKGAYTTVIRLDGSELQGSRSESGY